MREGNEGAEGDAVSGLRLLRIDFDFGGPPGTGLRRVEKAPSWLVVLRLISTLRDFLRRTSHPVRKFKVS